MGALSKTSLREQIYDIIKERIISQYYQLGEYLNIVTLSKEFEVSNSPIREALSLLSAEGLVTAAMNSKFRVIELTDEVIRELNDSYLVMIMGAYQYAITHDFLEDLEKLLEEIYVLQEQSIAQKDENLFIQCMVNFDRCFVAVLENGTLTRNFDSLSNLLMLAVRYRYEHRNMSQQENIQQHKQILEAVKKREHAQVLRLLSIHYEAE